MVSAPGSVLLWENRSGADEAPQVFLCWTRRSCVAPPLTFHPVHHLAGAPLAHGLHDQCHAGSLSPSSSTKEKHSQEAPPSPSPNPVGKK